MTTKFMKRDWDTLAREIGFQRIDDRVENESELEEFGRADTEMILSDLMEYLPEDAAVLEIGCGIGRLLAPMCDRFPEVWGIDVSGEMIAQAAKRLGRRPGLRLLENSGKDMTGVPDAHFDLCYSMQVLECAPTRAVVQAYVAEAHRVLKDGGVLKIQVGGVYLRNPFRRFYRENRDTWAGVRLTMSEAVAMIEKVGFQTVAAYHDRRTDSPNPEVELPCAQHRIWLVGQKGVGMDVWGASHFAAGKALVDHVPRGAGVILPHQAVTPFLASAGATHVTWMPAWDPADDASGIQDLNVLRENEGRYLLLTRDRLWWLETYPGMTRHLDRYHQRIAQSEDFSLFELS
jgi:SAM-dependent methyltransferase